MILHNDKDDDDDDDDDDNQCSSMVIGFSVAIVILVAIIIGITAVMMWCLYKHKRGTTIYQFCVYIITLYKDTCRV